jgi:hypothetical protein
MPVLPKQLKKSKGKPVFAPILPTDKPFKAQSVLIVGFRGARFGDELSRLRMPPKSPPAGAQAVGILPPAPSLF